MADAVKAVVAVVAKIFTKEAVKKIAVAIAVNAAARMLQPKSKDQSADRSSRFSKQRDSSPYRDVILGTAVTGGTFIDAIAYSTENMFYCEIIKLADHECDGLVAAYAGGRQLTINGDGSVQEYIEGSTPRMWIYFQAGAWGETTHSEVLTAFGGRYTANDRGRGVCRVILKCDMRSDKLFPSRSPPDLTFAVRGAKIYSPRLDTSLGGSHVWGNYATYAWTDNLADIAYNVARGVFVYGGAQPERLAGGSYDSEELPLANWAAESSACEVLVPLKAGGTERRYRGGLLFSTNEELEGILADLAAGAAGFMLDLGGTLIFQAGVARTPVATLTDADFIAGKLRRTWRQAARERFNTVTGRFTDPALRYQQNTLPIRRSTSDITADNNEERVETMSLGVVQSQTQGQRCMEIRRRSNRLNAMFQIELPPRWQHLEAGDWVTYTSARRGWTKTFVLLPAELKTTGEDMLVSALSMVEVSSNTYTWTPASDELDVINPVAVGPSAIPDATIAGFTAVASANTATNESAPAIEVAWTPPSDPTIDSVAIDYKRPSASPWLTQSFDAALGAGQITGLASGNWMVRARPITKPLRSGTASGIVTVSLAALTAGSAGSAATVPWPGVTLIPKDVTSSASAINPNGQFANYLVNGVPPGWSNWVNGTGALTIAGLGSNQNRLALTCGAGQEAGFLVDLPASVPAGYYVIEVTAALFSGTWDGSGAFFFRTPAFSDYVHLRCAVDADLGGLTGNSVGGLRIWRKLVYIGNTTGNTETPRFYFANHYSGIGSIASANWIVWSQAEIRPATDQEIRTFGMEDNADVTGANTAAAIIGQGTGATASNLTGLNPGEGTKLGGIEAGADVTAGKTAAAIAGQGALATKNTITFGDVQNGTQPNNATVPELTTGSVTISTSWSTISETTLASWKGGLADVRWMFTGFVSARQVFLGPTPSITAPKEIFARLLVDNVAVGPVIMAGVLIVTYNGTDFPEELSAPIQAVFQEAVAAGSNRNFKVQLRVSRDSLGLGPSRPGRMSVRECML